MKPFNLNRSPERDDNLQWDAVEEATELLLEDSPQEALYLLREVVKQDPRNPYAYFYIGAALFELGHFDACVDAYRAAVRLEPKYEAARVGLSHALRIAGDAPGAIAEARAALALRAGDGDALFALGLAQAAEGDISAAIASFEAFLASQPELETAIEARAMIERLSQGADTRNQS